MALKASWVPSFLIGTFSLAHKNIHWFITISYCEICICKSIQTTGEHLYYLQKLKIFKLSWYPPFSLFFKAGCLISVSVSVSVQWFDLVWFGLVWFGYLYTKHLVLNNYPLVIHYHIRLTFPVMLCIINTILRKKNHHLSQGPYHQYWWSHVRLPILSK